MFARSTEMGIPEPPFAERATSMALTHSFFNSAGKVSYPVYLFNIILLMKVFLNIIWYFPYFGFLLAIPVAITGVLLCLTLVGAPLGLGLLQIVKFLLAPHTQEMVTQKDLSAAKGENRSTLWIVFSSIVSFLYLPLGLLLTLAYIMVAIVEFVTILGIPNGIVIMKLIPSIFNPVGKVCVSGVIARKIQSDKDLKKVNQYFANTPAGRNNSQVQVNNPQSTGNNPQYFGYNPQAPSTAGAPSKPSVKTNPIQDYTDERLDEIISKPHLYNPDIVRQCVEEKDVRENINKVMPDAEAMDIQQHYDIIRSPEMYSSVMVRCSEILIKLYEDQQAEEEAEKEREQERLRQAQIQADQLKRQQQIAAVKAFILKWKFAIAGGVGALVTLILVLWLTSDSHRFSVAQDAFKEGDYAKVIEKAVKISDKDSKYYADALILGLQASDYHYDMSTKEQGIVKKLDDRLTALSKEEITDKNLNGQIFYWQRYYRKHILLNVSDNKSRYWRKIGDAFSDNKLTNVYNINMAKFTAAYAYFMAEEFSKSEALFTELNNEMFFPFKEYNYGYLGIMKLYLSPVDQAHAWDLLKKAPLGGIFAMYRGDACLIDINVDLRNRLQKAAECFRYITYQAGDPRTEAIVNAKRTIVNNLVNLEVWNRYGYYYSRNDGRYQGEMKSINGIGQPYGWGAFTYKTYNEKYLNYGYFTTKGNNVDAQTSIVYYPGALTFLIVKNTDGTEYYEKVADSSKSFPTNQFVNEVSMLSWDVFPIQYEAEDMYDEYI